MEYTLNDIMDGDCEWARERATMAIEIQIALEANLLTGDEAKELLANLLETESLQLEANEQIIWQYLSAGIVELIERLI
jgi:hypothetical protein